jgi:hypothetical protein
MSEEEDTCVSYVSFEEEDTCSLYEGHVKQRVALVRSSIDMYNNDVGKESALNL